MIKRHLFAAWKWLFNRLLGTRVARLAWKLPFSAQLFRLIVSKLQAPDLQVDGLTITLDAADSLLLGLRGSFEESERALVRAVLRPGDVVVDMGGHIGIYAVTAADCVGPAGHVYTFEPFPDNYAMLVHNVEQNGFSDIVSAHQLALADHSGSVYFDISQPDSSQFSVGSKAQRSIEVRADQLDRILDPQTSVDFIKADIEGSEAAALVGARAVLERSENLVMLLELNPRMLGDRLASFLDLLNELKGTWWLIDHDDSIVPTTIPALRRLTAGCPPEFYTNIVGARGADPIRRLGEAIDQVQRGCHSTPEVQPGRS